MQGKHRLKEYGIYIILLVLIIFFSITSPVFLTVKNFLTVARQVSMVGIASVGMMIVIVTGGIDLSIGSLMSLSNIICAYLMARKGWHPVLAVAFIFVIALACGFVEGVLISKVHVPPLIATLGFMQLLSGFAYLISGALPINGFPKGFKVLGQGMAGSIPVPVILLAIVLVLGYIIINHTYFGRFFYAIGGNIEAAKLSGIDVERWLIVGYMMSSFFACIASVVMLSRLNVGLANNGDGFEMDAITAVVLGGVSVSGGSGKLSGVIAGCFIVGFLKNGLLLLGVNDYVQKVIMGVVLLIAVSFDCIQKSHAADRKEKI